jgi:hypothetical protein
MRFTKWAVVLFVPTALMAADPPAEHAAPSGTTIKLLLLRQKSVQKDLKLEPATVKKVMEFTHAQHEAALKALKMEEGPRKKAFAKLQTQNEKFLADTLSEKQGKRLDQIALHVNALMHLTRAAMVKKLKLDEDQVKKCKELREKCHKELAELYDAKDRKGLKEKFAKVRADTRAKILAILTDEQKKMLRDLAGPPFEGEIEPEEEPGAPKAKKD